MFAMGFFNRWCVVFVFLAKLLDTSYSWQNEWEPHASLKLAADDKSLQRFEVIDGFNNNFQLLLSEGNTMLIGARNMVYNVSLADLQLHWRLGWSPSAANIAQCRKRTKTEEECQNYIKVIVRTDLGKLLVCGTHAYRPRCKTYYLDLNGNYEEESDTPGIAKSPHDFNDENTAVYADGKLYTATVSDFSARDPLIMEQSSMIRTQERDSKWLNDPDFISSFEMDDKIYFFFRESAVEHINCGKAVYSRVARICKNDMGGGTRLLTDTWTSFFKARLNCSIPGDYPFYFDEIQSTTAFGQGKFRPTFDSGDRSDIIYAVFSTPRNSVQASAVCAFQYQDIVKTFQGRFKGQESAEHNWLPVPEDQTPTPHPEACTNNSKLLRDTTLNFIKAHPLMDEAVPSAAGIPLLMHSSFRSQFTQIAVDWQVHAADKRYYDVMFVGTVNGYVIKAVNKAWTKESPVETVIIEEILVFPDFSPVRNLKVFRQSGIEKLIVVSSNKVVSLPLHRCEQYTSCRACVKLQDPYCSWDNGHCSNTDRGVLTFHENELDDVCAGEPQEVPSTTARPSRTVVTEPTSPLPCVCPVLPENEISKAGIEDKVIHTQLPQPKTTETIVVPDRNINEKCHKITCNWCY